MMSLLQRALTWEAQRLDQVPGAEPFLTRALAHVEMARWSDRDTLIGLLKEVWRQDKKSQGLPEELVQTMAGVMDDESLLLDMESSLPQPDGQGQHV